MYRNLVTSLFEHERVRTTDAKAKGVRSLAEKMITLGKRGDLHARRLALRVIRRPDVATKVFDDLAERFRDRPGGYTRIVKLGIRPGDAAPMSIIELVESGAVTPRAGKADKKAGAKTAAKAGAKSSRKKTAKSGEKTAKPKSEPAKKAPKQKAAAKKGAEKASAKKSPAKPSGTAKKKAVRKKKTD